MGLVAALLEHSQQGMQSVAKKQQKQRTVPLLLELVASVAVLAAFFVVFDAVEKQRGFVVDAFEREEQEEQQQGHLLPVVVVSVVESPGVSEWRDERDGRRVFHDHSLSTRRRRSCCSTRYAIPVKTNLSGFFFPFKKH